MAAFGQKLLRFGEIGRVVMRLRPGSLHQRIGFGAVERNGQAEHHRVHDLLIGNGVGDRLADLEIVERRVLAVHADIADAVADRRGGDGELAELLELDEILVR